MRSFLIEIAGMWSKFLRSIYYRFALKKTYQTLIGHKVYKDYLTATSITNAGMPIDPNTRISIENLELDIPDFCLLFSIFNGSDFTAVQLKYPSVDLAPAGTYIVVSNQSLLEKHHFNRTGIYSSGRRPSLHFNALHIDHFVLKDNGRPKQMATIAFALCAITAFKAGFSEITLLAAGGLNQDPFWKGYRVWPKLGFDAPLEHHERHLNRFSKCQTVQDLIAVDEAWWQANGLGRLMAFDLAPGSRSWKILLEYLNSRI